MKNKSPQHFVAILHRSREGGGIDERVITIAEVWMMLFPPQRERESISSNAEDPVCVKRRMVSLQVFRCVDLVYMRIDCGSDCLPQ